MKFCLIAILLIGLSGAEMPEPYYNNCSHILFSPDTIVLLLSNINYSSLYIEDEFDCTEIAAHCEYKLENMGIETEFVLPNTYPHMFIRCNTTEGWMAFEPCTPSGTIYVIWDKEDEYYKNNTYVKDIYDLVDIDYNSVNWWDTI